MKMYKIITGAVSVVIVSILVLCNGGSTEIGNARSEITGSIVDGGRAVDSAVVELVAEKYAPGVSRDGNVFTTRTDSRGEYRFESIPHGEYYLNAKRTGKRLLRGPLSITEPEELAAGALEPVSQMSVRVPPGWVADEVFVKGVAQSWKVVSGTALLDSLPSGEVTVVAVVKNDPAFSSTVKQTTMTLEADVAPGDVASAALDNAPPRIVSPPTSLVQVAGSTDTSMFNLNAVDPEGLQLRYSLDSSPAGISIDSTTGNITWNTIGAPAGDYSAIVKVTDAGGAYNSVTVSLTVAAATFPIALLAKVDTLVVDRAGSVGSVYLFSAEITEPRSVSAYRFSWGDGDTTGWQVPGEAARTWKTAGRYGVRLQVQYRADGSFSAWSVPLWIKIGEAVGNISPVITLIGPDTIVVPDSIKMADFIKSYKDPGYRAVSPADGDITSKVKVGPFSQIDIGVWYRLYEVTDAAGNPASTKKRIFLTSDWGKNFSPPIIDLVYPDSAIYIAPGGKWSEPGFTASDALDGNITSKVIVDSATLVKNIKKLGTYYVTYTVTNSSGITASRTRTVKIVSFVADRTPPVINLNVGDTIFCIDSIGIMQFMDLFVEMLPCTVFDDYDGRILDSIGYQFDSVSPWQGYLTYLAVDQAGNVATLRLLVSTAINPNSVSPNFALKGPVTISVKSGSSDWSETGYAAYDKVDGDLTGMVNVDMAGYQRWVTSPGTHYLSYWVTNSARSTVVATRRFNVEGAVPSDSISITLLGGTTDTVWLWRDTSVVKYFDSGATAHDPVYGDLTSQIIITGNVDVNKPGTYTRTYFVRNPDSLEVAVSRTVEVMIPPDDTSGMRSKYGVPTYSPLPSISATYTLQKVDGPSSTNFGNLKGCSLSWDSAGRSITYFQLYQVAGSDTTNIDISKSQHSFDTYQPALFIPGSGIANLDGPYIVKVDSVNMYWVAFNGSVVLVWRKV